MNQLISPADTSGRPDLLLPPKFRSPRFQRRHAPSVLQFSPLAWLKLQYLCHAGDTEVGGFGISAADDLLYVEAVETVLQGTSPVTVSFNDDSVADHFDRCADLGIAPNRCGRIWIHTHPGSSAEPSSVDEETFDRVFGPCDWAIMFILSRTGETYARLRISTGPGATILLPVRVDWPAWADVAEHEAQELPDYLRLWQHEYATHIYNLEPLNILQPPLWDGLDPTVFQHLEDTLEQSVMADMGEEAGYGPY